MQLNTKNYAKFTNVCTFRVNDCRFVQMNVLTVLTECIILLTDDWRK